MSLIPDNQNLFVVDIEYLVPLEMVDPLIEDHVAFLDKNYRAGNFLISGAKVPRTGGVILVTSTSVQVVQRLLADDPFYIHQIAKYTITEFRVGRAAPGLK